MQIRYLPGRGFNEISYSNYFHTHGDELPKVELIPKEIRLDTNKYCWQMSFCHELAHGLTSAGRNMNRFKFELLAWRIAKSFCKEKYWNEKEAIRMVLGHEYHLGNAPKIDEEKLKIIPLNTNEFLTNYLKEVKKCLKNG